MTTLETLEHNGYEIRLHPDRDPLSPREHATYGTIAASHSRYRLADEDGFAPSSEENFYRGLALREDIDNWDGDIEVVKDEVRDRFIILPVYMYEHSGVALSTELKPPFTSRWDAGQVGFIYMSREDAEEANPKAEPEVWAREVMKEEVELYGRYINGEVYGYRILDGEETVDSVWGFFDRDYALEEAKRVAGDL